MSELKPLSAMSRRQALDRLNAVARKLSQRQKPSPSDTWFMNQVLNGVQRIFLAEIRERQARIPGLSTDPLGFSAVWGGELTPGCRTCVQDGFAPVRSASSCNLRCKFCYYFGAEDQDEPLIPGFYAVWDRRVGARELKLMLHKVAHGPTPPRAWPGSGTSPSWSTSSTPT